jgi:outer membrane lipoprotein SlyB
MMRFLSYLAVLVVGLIVGALGGGLVGEMGGAALGGVAAVCKTIDAGVGQNLMTQDQANRLAKSLVTEFGVKADDLKAAVTQFNAKPEKSPCSVALAAL